MDLSQLPSDVMEKIAGGVTPPPELQPRNTKSRGMTEASFRISMTTVVEIITTDSVTSAMT